jgi:hypothetical protein
MFTAAFPGDEDVHGQFGQVFETRVVNPRSVRLRSLLSIHAIADDILEHQTIEYGVIRAGTLFARALRG